MIDYVVVTSPLTIMIFGEECSKMWKGGSFDNLTLLTFFLSEVGEVFSELEGLLPLSCTDTKAKLFYILVS